MTSVYKSGGEVGLGTRLSACRVTLSGLSGAHLVPSAPPQDNDLKSENNGRVNVAIFKIGAKCSCLSHKRARVSESFSPRLYDECTS